MDGYAEIHGISLSEAIKSVFFEKLEDEYDLKIVQEYEEEKNKGNMKYYTMDEAAKELGFDE